MNLYIQVGIFLSILLLLLFTVILPLLIKWPFSWGGNGGGKQTKCIGNVDCDNHKICDNGRCVNPIKCKDPSKCGLFDQTNWKDNFGNKVVITKINDTTANWSQGGVIYKVEKASPTGYVLVKEKPIYSTVTDFAPYNFIPHTDHTKGGVFTLTPDV